MCCISGFYSKTPVSAQVTRRLASALLCHGMTRGQHSAGAYSQATGSFRLAVPAWRLLLQPEFDELAGEATQLMLLHNRHPTSGGRGDKHAQPFTQEGTVTIHNGWVLNDIELIKSHELKMHTDVDSEVFTAALAKNGLDHFPDFLGKARGSAAIAAWHQNELYLVRTTNPLHYCYISLGKEKQRVFIFASTEEILVDAVEDALCVNVRKVSRQLATNQIFKSTVDALVPVGERITDGFAYSSGYQETIDGKGWSKKRRKGGNTGYWEDTAYGRKYTPGTKDSPACYNGYDTDWDEVYNTGGRHGAPLPLQPKTDYSEALPKTVQPVKDDEEDTKVIQLA